MSPDQEDEPLGDAVSAADETGEHRGPERRAAEGRAGRRRDVTERRHGLERRRGPGRRRGDVRRAAEEGEITDELFDFIMAIDEYKRVNGKPFPSWSEVFEVIKYLGYRKVAEQGAHIDRPAPHSSDAR